MLEQAVPDAEAFAAGASSTGIDGALPQPIGRLAASPGGGRGRGQAGKSRKPRG
jgi:hypothetical protein